MTTPPPPATPPGWHQVGGLLRYWDGTAWTEHTAPLVAPPIAKAWEPSKVNHVLHLLLTVFTCGLWGIVWLFIAIGAGGGRRDEQGRPIPVSRRTQVILGVVGVGLLLVVIVTTVSSSIQDSSQSTAVKSACREQLLAVGVTPRAVDIWHSGSQWTVTEQVTTAAGPAQWLCHVVLEGSTARVTGAGPD